MRKILFFLALIFALSFCASAFAETELIIDSKEDLNPEYYEPEYDEERNLITEGYYVLEKGEYVFASVSDALSFANNPDGYVISNYGSNYSVLDPEIFKEIKITLKVSELGGEIKLSNYSNLTSVIITGEPIVTANDRDIIIDNSSIEFTLQNITFDGKNSAGGIQILDTTSATFEKVTFKNIQNSEANGGAVEILGGSGILFNGCTFTNNSGDLGGAVYINGGSLTFEECKFNQNHANNGGAVYFAEEGNLTFARINNFTGNVANLNGGAVYTSSSSTPYFTGITFSETNTAKNGGAVYVASANTVFTSSTFNTNSADHGGALYIEKGNVTVDPNVKFSNNTATNGGTFYIANGTVNIYSDSEISSTATNDGGVFYVSGGTANIYSKLSGNTAERYGGAVFVGGGTVNISGDIQGNTASNGGAIFTAGGTTNILGVINDNIALNDGGAIYISGGTVNVKNSKPIQGNKASNNGGAIYLKQRNSKLNVSGSSTVVFDSNTAAADGGAIYAGSGSQMTFTASADFTGNTASNGNGGAWWIATSSQIPTNFSGTLKFDSNLAQHDSSSDTNKDKGNGAAIYVGEQTNSTVTLSNRDKYLFTTNTADCYGGAIYTLSSDITFDGFVVSSKNTANIGGGFAASGTGRITVQNSSKISNQTAPRGGAIYGGNITVESSDFTENTSTGTNSGEDKDGGGAIYSTGDLTLRGAYFESNLAALEGGAVFVYSKSTSSAVIIENSYFLSNSVTSGNGGAARLSKVNPKESSLLITIKTSTFRDNRSMATDGGALAIEGDKPEISECYFVENFARRFGGAVYYNQAREGDVNPVFTIASSMIDGNSSSGGNGGGLYIVANGASITNCTFYKNEVVATSEEGYGGALYLYTADSEMKHNTIDNCTFVENSINGGTSGAGGGALAVLCELTTMRSCTFTENTSLYGGGAIQVAVGQLDISGTIVVGNATVGLYDIWVDSNITSRGYNRIGVFGRGSGVTDFYSETRQETDRTAFPSKNWTRTTFFGVNELDDNIRTDLRDVPPYIGSERAGQIRLQTLMLSEDATLPLIDRASNVILYSARQRFPDKDARGVTRFPGGNRNFKADIGAVYFDGTRVTSDDPSVILPSIGSIQISGLTNSLKQVGESVRLVAKVYYTNGRTAYGGNGDGEEPVKWTVEGTGAGYVNIEADTGVLTVTKTATRSIKAEISVETVRMNIAGEPAAKGSKVFYLGGSGADSSSMNTTPGQNTEVDIRIRELIRDFEDWEAGYGEFEQKFMSAQEFQNMLEDIWGVTSASFIDLSEFMPKIVPASGNTPSAGFSILPDTEVTVSMSDSFEGEILPIPYPCNLSGDNLREILGTEIYDGIASDLHTASVNDSGINNETAKKIFSVLRVDFKDKNGRIWPVIGAGSNVDLVQALDSKILNLSADDNFSDGIYFKVNTCIMNVDAEQNSTVTASDADYQGTQLLQTDNGNILIVPDGINDDEIYGTLWVSKKILQASSTPQQSESKNQEPESTSKTETQDNSDSDSKSESGGGGGGCEIFNLGLITAGLILILKRKCNLSVN